jgi:NAD(P)H-hydrate epimerase
MRRAAHSRYLAAGFNHFQQSTLRSSFVLQFTGTNKHLVPAGIQFRSMSSTQVTLASEGDGSAPVRVPRIPDDAPVVGGATYLNAEQAAAVDAYLMRKGFFTTEQLMELAGLSAAQVIEEVYDREHVDRVLVVCGPGNNGGDGYVIARHLAIFGYQNVEIICPRPATKPQFLSLIAQAEACGATVRPDLPAPDTIDLTATVIVDAIFGYSFSGEIREPYRTVIDELNRLKGAHIVSVDIPSGWDVNTGPKNGTGIQAPSVVISLMSPKCGMAGYNGIHYLGGRFLPSSALVPIQRDLNIKLPAFSGSKQFVRLLNSSL